MKANFALKSGRDEWTRTTDPHLIRKVYVFYSGVKVNFYKHYN